MSGLAWKVRRLRRMTPREIVSRSVRAMEDRVWRLTHAQSRDGKNGEELARILRDPEGTETGFFVPGERSTARWLGPLADPGAGAGAGRRFPGESARLTADAERTLRGEIELFGCDELRVVGDPPRFSRDPSSGESWPDCFYADVDYRNPAPKGDVRLVWELNRLHHLSRLGAACRVTGDEAIREGVRRHFLDFLEQSRPLRGVAFASPLECAVRMISVALALAGIGEDEPPPLEFRRAVWRFFHHHARFVERRMALYSSRNNHTLGEAAALLLVGLLFPELAAADRWRERGATVLGEEILSQIHPDGVPCEQAVSYGVFALELVAVPWLVWRRSGREIPRDVTRRIQALVRFLRALLDAGGHLPGFGDSDDGRGFDLDKTGTPHAVTALRVATRLTGLSPGEVDLEGEDLASWLLVGDLSAADPGDRHGSVSGAPSVSGELFRRGGYAALRAGRDGSEVLLTFRCGPFGLEPLYGHAHADQLSVCLSVGGRPVLVDPGTYLYHGGGTMRDRLRSTAAHNTVCVEDRDQADIGGPFLWERPVTGTFLAWDVTSDEVAVTGTHDGYGDLGVVHERRLVLRDGGRTIRIEDRIRAEPNRLITIGWQFPHDLTVEGEAGDGFTITGDGEPLLFLRFPEGMGVEKVLGQVHPVAGWVSPGFGRLVASPRLVAFAEVGGDVTLTTEIDVLSRVQSSVEVPLGS